MRGASDPVGAFRQGNRGRGFWNCHVDRAGATEGEHGMAVFRNGKAGGCMMLVMGFIFAVAGGSVSWFLGADTTLTCKRSTDVCIIEKTNLAGRKEIVASIPLSRLKSAEVESKERSRKKNGNRRKPTHRVVLRTGDGTIPLSNVSTGDRELHDRNASDINRYLASTAEELTIVQSGKTVRLIGYLFFATGCLMFLMGLRGVFGMLLPLRSLLAGRG